MVFLLDEQDITFPPVSLAEPDGLLAVGGDLRPERLIEAYKNGIFPWYNDENEFFWWSPDPRLVIRPSEVYCSKSMRRLLREKPFKITVDHAFDVVIRACSSIRRPDQDGSWILPEMIEAYEKLHLLGYAHSVEAWDKNGRLAGGLYGVALGKIFFGESMFSQQSNASKAAFLTFAAFLDKSNFILIDSQQDTPHMRSLGGFLMDRDEFLKTIKKGLKKNNKAQKWKQELVFL